MNRKERRRVYKILLKQRLKKQESIPRSVLSSLADIGSKKLGSRDYNKYPELVCQDKRGLLWGDKPPGHGINILLGAISLTYK